MIHIFLHFLVPAIVAWTIFREKALRAWLIMMATMLVDLDHLLANPVYDPDRCSIGFHPLHSYAAVAIYFVMMFFPKVRLVGVGLVIHMVLDYLDCFL